MLNKIAPRLGQLFGGRAAPGLESPLFKKRPAVLIPGAERASELCMLPGDIERFANSSHALEGSNAWLPAIGQLKVDGYRALWLGGSVPGLVTREGMPMECADHCVPGLARLQRHYSQPMVFDTEYVADDGYEGTAAEFRRGEGSGTCWVFDAVPLDQWRNNRCTEPLELRLLKLKKALYDVEAGPFVGVLDSWFFPDLLSLQTKAMELWELGYEGLVAKRPQSRYQRGRSDAWLKVKWKRTVDARLLDVMHKGGRLSKIVVQLGDGSGDSREPPLVVGSGWSAEQARQLEIMDQQGGGIVEIRITRGAGSCKPRHAVFVRCRFDKESTNG